jgi:Ser/Thr protein kinase RdoA (MazF antagonist)
MNASPEVVRALRTALGSPVTLQVLKHKPRRLTLWAEGSIRSGIVKLYASQRAGIVARRVAALAAGPAEPRIPEVIAVEPELRMVVLSPVEGRPLRYALLGGDLATCGRVGAVLGGWHRDWCGRVPEVFGRHTLERELEILAQRMESAQGDVADLAAPLLEPLTRIEGWGCSTVVHRDLYEEHVMLTASVGLIDLDDAASGPPELDLGNLIAHVQLLEMRSGRDLSAERHALLGGYRDGGPPIDPVLLDASRRLALLRLACLHGAPGLVDDGDAASSPPPASRRVEELRAGLEVRVADQWRA